MRFSANDMVTCALYESTVHEFMVYAENDLDNTILTAATNGQFYAQWYPDEKWIEDTELPDNLKAALKYTLEMEGYKVEFCRDGSVNVGWGVN